MRELARLAAKVAEMERRIATSALHGTVAEVNPANGTLRLNLGDGDAGPTLSPWVRYAQTAGALKIHSPPSVGQQMTLASPGGELSAGVASPMGFSDGNPSPGGDGGTHVLTLGSVRIEATAGGVTITVGGVSMAITAGGVAITGGTVTHEGTNVGATHVHKKVTTGLDNTAEPL